MSAPYLLQHLLLEAASASPDRVALYGAREERTYAELEDESARIAVGLAEFHVGPGDLVGLVAEKTPRTVAAAYAILRRGAAYVPLDPTQPRLRIGATIERFGLGCVVTDAELVGPLRDACDASASSARRFVSTNELAEAPRGAASDARTTDGALAYVLSTSGSTGVPKGVAISHRNALAFLTPAVERFGLGPRDVLASQAPLHFDLSVFDLFGAALARGGASLFPAYFSAFPRKMGDAIEAHGVTVWSSVVSALRLLLERGGLEERALDTVRVVAFSGERMPFELLRQIAARLPWARLYNVYGQTEANSSTVYEITERDLARTGNDALPIGEALPNFEVFALDDAGHELTRGGDIGELYVRSASVAAGGYLRDPELSAARFVVDPRHPESGARAYRTGDRVERGEHGEFYLRGRADGLVKVRGHRVDLGEVEVALEALPGLAEVAALAIPDNGSGHRLAAFVRARDGVTMTRHEIAAHLALRLPRAVLPEHIEVRAELPHTSTGKIDRAALLASLVATPTHEEEKEARP